MPEIDPIQYGRLLASVEHLSAQLSTATQQLSEMNTRLDEVEGRFRLGKGLLLGIIFAAGSIGMGLRELVSALFGR